ncbi:hypothetical protein PG990_010036 [Apiospora arundinis]
MSHENPSGGDDEFMLPPSIEDDEESRVRTPTPPPAYVPFSPSPGRPTGLRKPSSRLPSYEEAAAPTAAAASRTSPPPPQGLRPLRPRRRHRRRGRLARKPRLGDGPRLPPCRRVPPLRHFHRGRGLQRGGRRRPRSASSSKRGRALVVGGLRPCHLLYGALYRPLDGGPAFRCVETLAA